MITTKADNVGYCRRSEYADIEYVAARLREADRQEVLAVYPDRTPAEVLHEGYERSAPCHTMVRTWQRETPEPVGMWGVCESEPQSRVGVIWMLGTDALVDSPVVARRFLRECRKSLPLILDTYHVLTNIIDQRNTLHIAFIEWLGFEVFPQVYKVNGHPFYLFRKMKENN